VSADLLEEAKRAVGRHALNVSFTVGDLRALPSSTYDAVICRGVLNDVINDDDRRAALSSFGRVLRRDGVLIMDVREWEATSIRKAREPLFRKRVETDRGTLTFTSLTELDVPNHQLLIDENHSLDAKDQQLVREYQFVMRCWTSAELHSLLSLNGFGSVSYFGAYDPAVALGDTDRLVAVAQSFEAGA
jgi:SAM-dependent methyltransferase